MDIRPEWSCEKLNDTFMIKAEFKRHGNTIRCAQFISERELSEPWYPYLLIGYRIWEMTHYLKEIK